MSRNGRIIMNLKLSLLLLSIFIVTNGCEKLQFPTEFDLNSSAFAEQQSQFKDVEIIDIDRVNRDIENGKVKGWESAKTQQDRYLALLNYFRSLPIQCNDARGYKGPIKGEVTWSDSLEEAAIAHSEDLLEHSQLGHRGSNGSTARERVKLHGFSGEYIGENVGYIMKDGIPYSGKEWISIFVDWINSKDGHCSNIMNKEYNSFGMGEAKSEEGNSVTLFWTQDFGKI